MAGCAIIITGTSLLGDLGLFGRNCKAGKLLSGFATSSVFAKSFVKSAPIVTKGSSRVKTDNLREQS